MNTIEPSSSVDGLSTNSDIGDACLHLWNPSGHLSGYLSVCFIPKNRLLHRRGYHIQDSNNSIRPEPQEPWAQPLWFHRPDPNQQLNPLPSTYQHDPAPAGNEPETDVDKFNARYPVQQPQFATTGVKDQESRPTSIPRQSQQTGPYKRNRGRVVTYG